MHGAGEAGGYRTEAISSRTLVSPASLGVILLGAAAAAAHSATAQSAAPRIPLAPGLTVVSALHTAEGDRENVVTVTALDDRGATYGWHFREPTGKTGGAAPTEGELRRFVRTTDLAHAPRLDAVFEGRASASGTVEGSTSTSPGFTAFSVSSDVYGRLRRGDTTRYTITALDGAGGLASGLGRFGAMFVTRVTMRGTLAPISTEPESIPVLLDGSRVSLPALHLQGRFHYQDRSYDLQLWVLADSSHPLILRTAADGEVLQTIRIDRPGGARVVESELSHACRAELPGIYFAFGSAALEPESRPTLEEVARLFAAHPDWRAAIEGHTDSIGSAAANRKLSAARAAAVRAALVDRYHVASSRLTAVGRGSSRPRESNSTIEGRAANRRVELVRPCAK